MGGNEREGSGAIFERIGEVWSRRKGLIVTAFVIVVTPAIVAVLSLPRVYAAKASVIPLGGGIAQASALGGAGRGTLASVSQQVLSRGRLEQLIRHLNLYADARRQGSASMQSLVRQMRGNVAIESTARRGGQGAQAASFSVGFRGGDPGTVAVVANALAQSFESVAGTIQAQEASAQVQTLKTRIAVVGKKLGQQQHSIENFRNAHTGALPEEQNTNLAILQRLNAQLQDNNSRQLQILERRGDLMQQMGSSNEASLPVLQQRLAELRTRYTDKYPEVIAVKARIRALKQAGGAGLTGAGDASPLERQLTESDRQLAALKKSEKNLRARIARYQHNIDAAPATAEDLKSLTRGYEETSALYSTLLKRYEQARVAEATAGQGGPQYRILESAQVPDSPVGPARLQLLAAILIIGLGFAGALAFMVEQWDSSFHSLQDLRDFTSVPILAAVPVIKTRRSRRRRRLRTLVAVLLVICAAGLLGSGARLYAQGNQALAQQFSHHGT